MIYHYTTTRYALSLKDRGRQVDSQVCLWKRAALGPGAALVDRLRLRYVAVDIGRLHCGSANFQEKWPGEHYSSRTSLGGKPRGPRSTLPLHDRGCFSSDVSHSASMRETIDFWLLRYSSVVRRSRPMQNNLTAAKKKRDEGSENAPCSIQRFDGVFPYGGGSLGHDTLHRRNASPFQSGHICRACR